MVDECIFCNVVNGILPSEKVFESKNFLGILNISPLTPGHTLLISKKHFETILDLPSSLGLELLDDIQKIAYTLFDKEGVEGFNILQNNGKIAQQEIPHLHFHLIPRKENDSKNFKFE